MSFSITLYKNTAEPNRVDKTNYLTSVGSISGTLREETSIISVTLTIEYSTMPDFNYVYIPTFNRYYYVDNIASIRNNLWEIDLSVDVLMSFKDAILNCDGFVERNEKISNPLLVDKRRVIEEGFDKEVIEVPNSAFIEDISSWEYKYVLNGYKLGVSIDQ